MCVATSGCMMSRPFTIVSGIISRTSIDLPSIGLPRGERVRTGNLCTGRKEMTVSRCIWKPEYENKMLLMIGICCKKDVYTNLAVCFQQTLVHDEKHR